MTLGPWSQLEQVYQEAGPTLPPWSDLVTCEAFPQIIKPWSALVPAQYPVASIRVGGEWRPAIMTWVPPV